MDRSKFFFLIEESDETFILGPYALDITYLEVIDDMVSRCKNFTPEHSLRYAIPGKSGRDGRIRSEADLRHMMILHEASNETVVILKINPPSEGPQNTRHVFFL